MKTLEQTIRKGGFTYNQVARNDKAAMYTQHDSEGNTVGVEVFKIRSHNGYELHGTVIAPAEMFPSAEAFGTWAWSYGTYGKPGIPDKAIAKYHELTNAPELPTGTGQGCTNAAETVDSAT